MNSWEFGVIRISVARSVERRPRLCLLEKRSPIRMAKDVNHLR